MRIITVKLFTTEFGPVVQEEMSFKVSCSSGDQFAQRSWTVCAILWEGINDEEYF